MSNKRVKSERSKAKDARQMPAQDKETRSRSKKDKPIRVLCRFKEDHPFYKFFGDGNDWRIFGRYRDEETAETAIRNDKRKSDMYEYKIASRATKPHCNY